MSESSDPRKQYCSLVDLNTVSGSSERIRNTLGGYFYTDTDSHGLLNVPPSFEKMNPVNNRNPNILSVTSVFGEIVQTDTSARGFGEGYADFRQTQMPYTNFVCRVEGDPTSENLQNVLVGNKFWKTLFVGGTYDGQFMLPMFSTGTYDNNYTIINLPYNNKDKIRLKKSEDLYDFVEATYRYNRHYPNYQIFANSIDSERKLPMFYKIFDTYTVLLADPFSPEIENYNRDYYTFNKQISPVEFVNIIDPIESLAKPEDRIPEYWTEEMKLSFHYLNNTFPARFNSIPAAVLNEVDMRNRNIIFPGQATTFLLDPSSLLGIQKISHFLPFYNRIKIVNDISETSNYYKLKFVENKADTIFLKTLKEAFLQQTDGYVPIRRTQFMKTSRYVAPSNNTETDNTVTSNMAVSYRTVDMIKMLMYGYENVLNETKDFQIIGPEATPEKTAALDTKGLYRSVNSKMLSILITDIYKTFGDDDSATKIDNLTSLLNCQYENITRYPDTLGRAGRYDAETIAAVTPIPATNEIIAYRIEKRNRIATGDSETTRVLQNFWMMPNVSQEEIELIDSQVKYGTDYEYRIYAYYIVKGYKYNYSNLQLSRIIGQVSADGYAGPIQYGSGIEGEPTEPPIGYCIEYYDPFTDRTVPDYLIADPATYNISSEIADSISGLSGEAQRIGLSSLSDPLNRYPPYVAQFNVTLQPSLNIIEVPILRKTYKILDNPPNDLDVIPGYTLNNNNTITFQLNYQSHSPHKYPRAINETDRTVRTDYINANDITEKTLIKKETVSYPREVLVYRLDTKPKSFEDFTSQTPRQIPLKIDGSDFAYTSVSFNDIIKSNQKHYYLFRVVNDNNIAGNVNTIIEAELVNDGGYKYALFDTLFEEDLIEEEFTFPSTSFKNIFQLVPNMSQVMIDENQVNYQDTARNQYDNVKVGVAEDLIWGKTFKIRLTSKKTGKKIDLNITYSDPDINLEE